MVEQKSWDKKKNRKVNSNTTHFIRLAALMSVTVLFNKLCCRDETLFTNYPVTLGFSKSITPKCQMQYLTKHWECFNKFWNPFCWLDAEHGRASFLTKVIFVKITKKETSSLRILFIITNNETSRLQIFVIITNNQTSRLQIFVIITSNQTSRLQIFVIITNNQTSRLQIFVIITNNQTSRLQIFVIITSNQSSRLQIFVTSTNNQTSRLQISSADQPS
jgi:hypothetical protein